MLSQEKLAQRILEVIPLIMRVVGANIRQETSASFRVSHHRVLKLLYQRPRTISELAACQAVALPTMSRTISTLVERGWVTRTEDTNDRRRVLVQITDEGRAILDQLHSRIQAHMTARLAPLTAEERELVLAGLEILEKTFTTEELV